MPELDSQKIVARQVERIVRQLTSLSTLPAVAGDLLGQLNDGQPDPMLLIERIESDPALTARVLAVAHREGITFSGEPTIPEAVSTLSAALLREAVISVKVFGVVGGGETVEALKISKMFDDLDWVSTGGGAMLAYLSGAKMPGLKGIVKGH